MIKFKDGDLVYCPTITSEVIVIQKRSGASNYPLTIKMQDGNRTFTEDGKAYTKDLLPAIFPATDENRKALEVIYGVKFEVVPKDSESKAAYQKFGEASDVRLTLCSVSSESQSRANNTLAPRLIVSANKVSITGNGVVYQFLDTEGVIWSYAKFLGYVEIQ